QLGVTPVVKYTALSIFAERFLPSIKHNNRYLRNKHGDNWLLQPLRQCNLQLLALISLRQRNLQGFALISVWMSSKKVRSFWEI
ncbi:hypothetical protein MKW92_015045, partial [Papaver armeniacum]